MKKIFAFTSEQGCGCTFLEWTANFLAGHYNYYQTLSNQVIDLVDNPLTANNAHLHDRNRPNGYQQTLDALQQFSLSNQSILSLYPTTLRFDTACEMLEINRSELIDPKIQHAVADYINQDYSKMIAHLLDIGVDVVYVAIDKRMLGYHWTKRSFPSRPMFEDLPVSDEMLLVANDEQVFFHSSIDQWQQQGLTEIWDVRERMALDNRPFDWPQPAFEGSAKKHLFLNCQEVWFDLINVVQQTQKFLGLPIQNDKYQQWLPIATQWQQIQINTLKFWIQLEHIVNAVVNGYDYALPRLTLKQESIIQHCLIYQHNLNLKTWGLTHFPNNARLLHQLLEPNIHTVTAYRGINHLDGPDGLGLV